MQTDQIKILPVLNLDSMGDEGSSPNRTGSEDQKKEDEKWNGWHAGRHANATTTLMKKPLDNKRLFLSSFAQ